MARIEQGSPATLVMRREVDRFIRFASQRSCLDASNGRRKRPRHHRSWPLLVSMRQLPGMGDISVALHDASEGGIGFLSHVRVRGGTRLYVKLFWYERGGYRVPVTVRHATPTPDGWLIGCSFDVDDAAACERALSMTQPWYG
jgi:hypothetical protein